MNHSAFAPIEACVFDAYGTLFDVHSAVGQHAEAMGASAGAVSQLWRTKQLEYTWLRSLMGTHCDFWQLTGDALDYALDSHDIHDRELRDQLMQAYLRLDAYPEVIDVLTRLGQGGMKLAILSNGSPDMLAAAVNNAGLAELLDAVLSIEEVGIYKPDARVYRLVEERLGVDPAAVAFQSSNAWDAVGAAVFGFKVAWVNRFGQRRERLPAQPQAEIKTLAELPALLGIG